MLKCRGIYKNPNGKLVVIDAHIHDNKIINLEISGDFFAYPEEAIDDLENQLKDLHLSDLERALIEKSSNIVFIGLGVDDIIRAIREMKCVEETLS